MVAQGGQDVQVFVVEDLRAEFRSLAVLGALFLDGERAPFVLGVPAVYQALGIMYLAIDLVRIISMFLDKSVVQSNIISLAVEVAFGIILVL